MNKISDKKRNSEKYHHRSIRLKDYDYSQAGAYFVTICTKNNEHIFGKVVNGKMRLNKYGRTVNEEWRKTPKLRKNVKLDTFGVMPNHFHGIVVIDNCRGVLQYAPTKTKFQSPSQTIGLIVRGFKSAVTKKINMARNTPGKPVWQRNYYEHVIRNERGLNLIREYILNNSLQWLYDQENPEHIQDKGYKEEWGDFERMVFGKTKINIDKLSVPPEEIL